MEPSKACGSDGATPDVFRSLPAHWIVLITGLFKLIFRSTFHQVSWTNVKMFTIFKRGNRRKLKNYRGITIVNSMAKLYDLILGGRLNHWFKLYMEQAGARKGRSCIEQSHIIVTNRSS